ncbi:hypothetical protein Pyn_19161 [Prunus yedoensis var. nudiflora]|uniref:Uncharacterized protein n=1 Tax=Prunus yedoensis var. nudiflora TaxID=2094558 RepID=A0A314YW78_PRUYE|nr:hypothetical protein Pyn_19161 [Prunus yedoensis var. nudiflora]
MTRGSPMLNTKPTVSLKEANHKTVCFVYKGNETSSSSPGTQCLLCNSENLTKGGSPTPTKLWCVRSLLHGIEPSQTQRQAGTFIEHLVCTQGVAPQLSKGSSMESTTKFQAFQGVVRPLLSQRGSASGRGFTSPTTAKFTENISCRGGTQPKISLYPMPLIP